MASLQLPKQENWDKQINKRLRSEFAQRLRTRLKEVRDSKNLTQQAVSAKAGLDLSYLGHLEAGKYHPTAYVLWKIAKALGVSVDKLLEV